MTTEKKLNGWVIQRRRHYEELQRRVFGKRNWIQNRGIVGES